jgi:hypothetical protein
MLIKGGYIYCKREMNKILNFFTVFGVFALCVKYYFDDKVSLVVAGVILFGSVFLASRDGFIWQFIKAGVAIFSFGLLLVGYSYNMNDFKLLIQPILISLIALFGIFIMLRGLFKSKSSDDEAHYRYDKKTGKLKRKKSWW